MVAFKIMASKEGMGKFLSQGGGSMDTTAWGLLVTGEDFGATTEPIVSNDISAVPSLTFCSKTGMTDRNHR